MTNCAFNKYGTQFITGSYDKTCKLWDTMTGENIHTLSGHTNIVYCLSFNNPYGDKIATGSFDKTTKIWSVEDGTCLKTLRGHTEEVVSLSFEP